MMGFAGSGRRDAAYRFMHLLSDQQRVALMADLLIELNGDRGLEFLSKVRATVSLRMQELIDERCGYVAPPVPAREGLWSRIKRWNARLEDSWVGDLIGAACLFTIGYSLTIIFWVLS